MYYVLKRCKIGLLHKQLSIFSKFCMIHFKIYSFGHFGRPKPRFVPGISGMPETLPETSMPETLPTLIRTFKTLRTLRTLRTLKTLKTLKPAFLKYIMRNRYCIT